MAHIVLLGDSIFDNAAYVPAGTEVGACLQSLPGRPHRVSLLARLRELPVAADWRVVSCGGNDVLGLVGAMHAQRARYSRRPNCWRHGRRLPAGLPGHARPACSHRALQRP